jgi:hypothetical protein
MNVMEMAMPDTDRWTARQQYKRYMKAVADGKNDPRYHELAEAYKQMGMGRRVVSLFNAMQRAGADSAGRPRLAVVRADQRWCWFEPQHFWKGDAWCSRFVGDPSKMRPRDIYGIACHWKKESSNAIAFPSQSMPWTAREKCVAAVPLMPPEVRPRSDCSRYHILFEANWLAPPKDPLLLRRVGRDVWTILAQWDLTEIERAVLNSSQMF